MSTSVNPLKHPITAIENTYDSIKQSIKWKYGIWESPRIDAYRGYGTRNELYLKGRVLDETRPEKPGQETSLWQNIRRTLKRIESDEIPGALVRLYFGDQVLETRADEDEGFFEFTIQPGDLPTDQTWHEATLELLEPEPRELREVRTPAHILVPRPEARVAIVSDLDDTVVKTGATNKLNFMSTVLLNNARSRVPFPGIAALYRALQEGLADEDMNPIFYLSSSPWNLYAQFSGFMEAHNIPHGPIFLKDFGMSESKLFKTGHTDHKAERIRGLLETYPSLDFVLLGDSGQKDPEIYREVVAQYPDRFRAVYIRDVTPNDRDDEVQAIAEEVQAFGVPMLLADNTVSVAEHAAALDLIRPEAVDAVRAEKQEAGQT